jgi:hypothetical protein
MADLFKKPTTQLGALNAEPTNPFYGTLKAHTAKLSARNTLTGNPLSSERP